jgi:hypothetical protein
MYLNTNKLYTYFSGGRSPSTWRAGYNFEYAVTRLSKLMKEILRDALDNEYYIICKKSSFNALKMLCLCDEKWKLTDEGRVLAISLSSLRKQTKILSLPLSEVSINYDKLPEIGLRNYLLEHFRYKKDCFAEGGDIKILLSCMCFDLVRDAWRIHWRTNPSTKSYYDAFGESAIESSVKSYTYSSPLGSIIELISYENNPDYKKKLIEKIIDVISYTQKWDIEKAFITLRHWHADMGWTGDNWPWQNYVGLDLSNIISLYEIIGNKVLTNIAKTFFIEPLAFSKGWPDLTTIDYNGNLRLIEIKTVDRLFVSQIITISEMIKYFQISVIKVNRLTN